MPGAYDWTISRSTSGDTEHIGLYQDGRALTFRQYFALLEEDRRFAGWYTEQLQASPFSAFFWEHPPLGRANIESAAHLVLVNAPVLDALRQDDAAFRRYFSGDAVVSFRNLGGDALLIAPSLADASTNYAHLVAFLRTARESQVQALWQEVARSVAASLDDEPTWLSTSGLGVAWLHVRLDSSPKYYQHRPFKRWPANDQEGL